MKSPSRRPPVPCHVPFVACCALSVTLALAPTRAHANTCDPVFGLIALKLDRETGRLAPPFTPANPSVSLMIEVPLGQYTVLTLYVLNLGCAPLDWKIRDVEPGTQLDCPWISESPDSGTVSAAGSEPGSELLAARIAPFLAGGTYRTDLLIASNDPIRPMVTLSLTLVVAAPTATKRHTLGQLKGLYREPAATRR